MPTYPHSWSLPTKQPYGCQAYATSQARWNPSPDRLPVLKNCSSYRLCDTPGYPVVNKRSSIPGRLDVRQQCSLEEASLPNLGTHRIEALPFDSTQHRLEVHPNYCRSNRAPSDLPMVPGPRAVF